MGKGTRNRLNREIEVKPVRKKRKIKKAYKPMPAFVKPLVTVVVLVAIVFGATFGILASNGVFKRANILVKSQTGHYDIDQQAGTYLAWEMAYYQASIIWQYYGSSLSSSYDSGEEYCLNSAASAIQGQLKTSLEDLGTSYMIQLVAVCDEAERNGVTLTKEEKKEAKTEAVETLMSYDCYSYPTTASFIKAVIGNNVKQKDIERIGVLSALYTKYLTQKQEEFEGVDLSTIQAYRDENAESYYSSDYVTYETTDEALANLLLTKTDKTSFVTAIVKSIFDANYKAEYNKYIGAGVEASAFLAEVEALTDKSAANLATKGMTEISVTTASEIDETLKTWVMDASRSVNNATSIICGEKYVVAVITAAANEGTVKVATKEFAYADGTAYGTSADADYDAAFADNMFASLLYELKVTETAPTKDYTESENAKILSLFTNLYKAVSGVSVETKNLAYTAEPGEEDALATWLYGGMTNLTALVSAGQTLKTEKTVTDETTSAETKTYTVYLAEKVMYLDETVEEGETQPAWEIDARSDYANEQISNMITARTASYTVSEKGMKKIKDKSPLTTDETAE